MLNSKEESDHWEQRYGEFAFKGAWSRGRYHPPQIVPELEEGNPVTKPYNEHAVNFIIRKVREFPNEVTLWAGGPLTNFAMAIAMDPEIPALAKELVLMGAGFNEERGNIHRVNSRREFNWWWDPEAVRMVMSANWKKITITPHDIGVKARITEQVKAAIARVDTPLTRYLTKFSRVDSLMWDEVSMAAWVDPGIISKKQNLYVNIDIDHGASYGQTIFLGADAKAPPWWKLAEVQFDLNVERFHKIYVDLMTRPAGSGRGR